MKYSITFVFEYWFDGSDYKCHRTEARIYNDLNEMKFKEILRNLVKNTNNIIRIEVESL
jgi:hypothetical protein